MLVIIGLAVGGFLIYLFSRLIFKAYYKSKQEFIESIVKPKEEVESNGKT